MLKIRRRSRRTLGTEIAVVVAVCLFFVAGIMVESQRNTNRERVAAPNADEIASSASGLNADSTATAAPETASEPSPAPTSEPAVTSTRTAVVAARTPNPGAVGQTVFIDLQGIENESVIEDSAVTVSGITTPDALLSINGQPVEVNLDGSFTADLQLDPGPNFVEIVSSNLRGEETSRVLSVVSVQ